MSIRSKLMALYQECEALCIGTGFVGPVTGQPSFRLIYTSVKTFERSNRFVIVGMNPSGDKTDADTDDRDRPFVEDGYSAYLDDDVRGSGPGQDDFQRVVQAIAMVVTGTSSENAVSAMRRHGIEPERRTGKKAEQFLRSTPSLNIIPFRHSKLDEVGDSLRVRGAQIGWKLLRLIEPRPRYIITLANQVKGPIWNTILRKSGRPNEPEYEEWINQGLNRKYREITLGRGALKGAVLLGLPAVVHEGFRRDVTPQMLNVFEKRLRYHGHLQ